MVPISVAIFNHQSLSSITKQILNTTCQIVLDLMGSYLLVQSSMWDLSKLFQVHLNCINSSTFNVTSSHLLKIQNQIIVIWNLLWTKLCWLSPIDKGNAFIVAFIDFSKILDGRQRIQNYLRGIFVVIILGILWDPVPDAFQFCNIY